MINKRTSDAVLKPKLPLVAALLTTAILAVEASASVPVPEKLLPDDTLLVVSSPDFAKVRDIYKSSGQAQIWNDPALKPFKDHFLTKWKEQVTDPLERELDIKLDDYTSLPQGQVTFALIQNGWQGREEDSLGVVLLIDAKDKSSQLKTNLGKLRKKWVDSGKTLRTEKIRDFELIALPLSSNDVPKTIRSFIPQKPEVQEAGEDNDAKKPSKKSEIVIGQADSLLILADSTKTAEKIVSRLGGGSLPSLADLAAFQGNQTGVFRDAPIFGWVNLKTFIDILSKSAPEKKDPDAAPDPFAGPRPEKVLSAIGASSLRTLSFAVRNSNEGTLLQFFLGVPESGRTGIFKIVTGEPKETSAPPFVPADAAKFQRWRLDGQKVWAAFEKILTDLSPQAGNTINMLLDMATASAKEKDPGFDVRKNLIGNLGDDMITYKKAPRGSSPEEILAAPSIFLLGSPNPDQLVAAMRSIFGMTSSASGAPSEREFLGRKIYSTAMPNLPMPGMAGNPPGKPRTLQYVATSGYVAMTTDASMIEEFLRSSDSQRKALRETPGLVEAAQKVTGPGTGLFGFENQAETMRATFEMLRKSPESAMTNSTSPFNPFSGSMGIGNAEKGIKDLMDFSLLPPFDKIAKYFYISVYAASATSEGLSLKVFAPTPPAMKAAAGAK
jgi:hypothetical protein